MLRRSGVEAIHVHHGLSPNADAWAAFCRRLCKRLGVPLKIQKVKIAKRGEGLEAAARRARYEAFAKSKADCIALAHNLDDQAETVLMNLLRGAGVRGARGMLPESSLGKKTLLRPLLGMPRAAILAYARAHDLEWVEDESNADESLTRNFMRRRVGPLLDLKYPKWREALARAARHFSAREAGAEALLRKFLQTKGLRAPSEAKLAEMLKQLTSKGRRTLIEHDGARLRLYRGAVLEDRKPGSFAPIRWTGEQKLEIPELGGELRFRAVRGKGFLRNLSVEGLSIRLRSGGERLQPDPRRPRRTLKNLFQEAGVPPWERERLPMLARGDEVVWVAGLGVDAKYRAAKNAPGVLPEWRKMPG
jgi:tRNA(Ile)-lysidine synthase